MHWHKQGLVYACHGRFGWNRTHAAVPVVDVVGERVWRIYYASRDEQNRSRIGYVEVEAGNPSNILYEHAEPILPLGRPGTFDDCGIMPSWFVRVDERVCYLYTIGVTTRQTVPFQNAIGLAISRDGGHTFAKYGEGPLFGPTPHEPYFTGTSCVLIEDGLWRNWYLSCVGWQEVAGRQEPLYHFKYAESQDGIQWRREGAVCLELRDDEAGLAKASVLRDRDGYRMWYSARGLVGYRTDPRTSYRIGYATSRDGLTWTRSVAPRGLDPGPEHWDNEMAAYPHVVRHGRKLFLFYNGNGFGRTGFGYATCEVED